MTGDYGLFVRHEVFQAVLTATRTSRMRIIAFIESLSSDPFQQGDYTETDSAGRNCQVKIIGKHAVYFWADHAVKEVKVVDLIDADRT